MFKIFTTKKIVQFFALLMAASLALTACAGAPAPASNPAATQNTASTPATQQVTLKIALIPVLDTLPMLVAQQEGLFAKYGVNVEFIPVGSAPQRDQMITSGQADGMVNEALSTMLFNKDQIQVVTVRYARTATADSPVFRILSSAKSGITTPEGLKGVEIGISQGTIIEYLTYRLLEAEGLKTSDIKTVAVPDITQRMALLNGEQVKAAVLPDPVATLSIQQGAHVVIDDTKHPEYSFSTITFRKTVVDQHPDAIRAFLAAVEEATQAINANPAGWTQLLSDKKLVPQPLLKTFTVPRFVSAGVPTEAQWNDVVAWAKEHNLLTKDVPYAGSVDASYLPK